MEDTEEGAGRGEVVDTVDFRRRKLLLQAGNVLGELSSLMHTLGQQLKAEEESLVKEVCVSVCRCLCVPVPVGLNVQQISGLKDTIFSSLRSDESSGEGASNDKSVPPRSVPPPPNAFSFSLSPPSYRQGTVGFGRQCGRLWLPSKRAAAGGV